MVSQTGPTTRDSAYAVLNSSREELRRAIEGLTAEQMTDAVIDGWSIKDQLAHVAFWEELMAQDFLRVARGHAAALMYHSSERTDDLNDLIISMRRKFPLGQVLSELDRTRVEMMAALDALPDEAFATGFVPAFLGICGRHDEEHSELIDRWRKEAGI